MNDQEFSHQIFFSTVRITAAIKSSKSASIGTGFLVMVTLKDGGKALLLVSNRHVFVSSRRTISLNFVRKDNQDGRPDLNDVVSFPNNTLVKNLIRHPDKTIDLACVNISGVENVEEIKPYYRNFTPENLATLQEVDILPGNEVMFVGYPENRFDTAHNLPILRKGFIASMPQVDFNGRPEFVIDAQVFPGSSGSPVLSVTGSEYKLVGVVAQTMIKNSKLQIIPTKQAVGVQQTLGLGIVIKSTELKKLLDHAVKQINKKL